MRARNVKPGYFDNEVLCRLPHKDRLLFQGLWCLADREGRFEWRPSRIRAKVFPYEMEPIEDGLERLMRTGFIAKYMVNSQQVGLVVNFHEHQNPHPHEAKSRLPEPPSEILEQIQRHDMSLHYTECNADSLILCSSDSGLGTPPIGGVVGGAVNGQTPTGNSSNPEITEQADLLGENPEPTSSSRCPHQEIIRLYHETLPELPRVRTWTGKRQKWLQARWREDPERQTPGWWQGYFEQVRTQAHLMGENGRGWKADLEFLVKAEKMARVLENYYKSNGNGQKSLEEQNQAAGQEFLRKVKKGE